MKSSTKSRSILLPVLLWLMLYLPLVLLLSCHSPTAVAPQIQELVSPEPIVPTVQEGTLALDGMVLVPALLTAATEAEGFVIKAQALNNAPGFVSVHFKAKPAPGFYAVEKCALGTSTILTPNEGKCSIYTYGTEAGMAWSQAQVPTWVQVKEEDDKLILVFNQVPLSQQDGAEASLHWVSGYMVVE